MDFAMAIFGTHYGKINKFHDKKITKAHFHKGLYVALS